MAKPVKLAKGKEFVFKTPTKGAETKYDWDTWFSGDLLMLEQSIGEKDDKGTVTVTDHKNKRDYEVSTEGMPGKLKNAARKRYKVVQVSRHDQDNNKLKDCLIIKARDMTDDERVEEDIRRAEEKAALQAKKAESKSESGTDTSEEESEAA